LVRQHAAAGFTFSIALAASALAHAQSERITRSETRTIAMEARSSPDAARGDATRAPSNDRTPEIAGGAALFIATYGITAALGAVYLGQSPADLERAFDISLLVPGAGPVVASFLDMSIDSTRVLPALVLLADGVAQSTGIALFIAGLVASPARVTNTRALRIWPAPFASSNATGVALSARWF
jgi:hypothetical protein